MATPYPRQIYEYQIATDSQPHPELHPLQEYPSLHTEASSPLPKQDNNHNHKSSEGKNSEKNSERASSKNSRCSFEYYEKKILKNTFISTHAHM